MEGGGVRIYDGATTDPTTPSPSTTADPTSIAPLVIISITGLVTEEVDNVGGKRLADQYKIHQAALASIAATAKLQGECVCDFAFASKSPRSLSPRLFLLFPSH